MSRRASLLTILAVVLVALNLRGAIAAVPPVLEDLQAAVGLTTAQAALMTSLPVLLFALAAPLAARLGRRLGPGRAVLVGLALIGAGTLVRVVGGPLVLLLGTAVVGLGITVGNVLVPVVIKRDLPGHASRVTGFFTATLAVGAALTSALTVPVAQLLGWRAALALWVVLVPVAAVGWWRHVVRRERGPVGGPAPGAEHARYASRAPGPSHTPPPSARDDRFVWRLPIAWALAVVLGCQSALYYSLTTWLPTILVDRAGVTHAVGGTAMALYQITAIPTALTIANVARLRPRQGWIGVLIGVAWTVMVAGLLLAPGAWPLWAVVGGLAQGAGFTYALTLIVLRGRDEHVVRALNAMGQFVGYTIGAAGPFAVGWLAQTTGGWTAPGLLLVGLAVALGASSLVAGRDVVVEPAPSRAT
ncbi:MFS transporter [Ornithinimicrobium sp. W1665]|uniref:MFS transporter n=1 Tax=Ornithinimicrobium sp. W1665 TaxID=3416666 RepID=UPI003CF91986